MANVAYVRVSSFDQNPERQIKAIEAVTNIDEIFIDKATGANLSRPELENCKRFLRKGDTLFVASIDRLARNLRDLLATVQELTDKGVVIKFLKENLTISKDSNDMTSTLILQIFGIIAEFERTLISERQKEGIAIAKAKGIYRGRPLKITEEQKKEIVRLVNEGVAKTKIAKKFKIARHSVYNVLKEMKEKEELKTAS